MKALSTKRRAYAGLMRALMLFSVLLTGALVLFLIGYVLWKGIPNITWELRYLEFFIIFSENFQPRPVQ